MSELKIASAEISNFEGTITDYSVDPQITDGAGDTNEYEYINDNWSQQLGYYKAIPELQAAIDAKATWTVGKGYQSNEITELLLMQIKGFGVDTFNTILENMIRTYNISGDSFAEIIRDKGGRLINIKCLDPSSIKIVVNRQGKIKRYEQLSKIKGQSSKRFKPERILHLSRNRVADEVHGVSLIDAVEWIILAKNEAMDDLKQLMHRHVKPVVIFHLDTDDTAEIAAYKAKMDLAYTQGENIYVPKGVVVPEVQAVASNATLSPLPWITYLDNKFYQACGVPQIIVGGSQEFTEATAKIAYLAFEQTIEEEQLYIEEQILSQLNLEIELEFPASLENELLAAEQKGETMQASTPEDTAVQGMPLGRTA
jgi:hypothetical protein